MIADITDEHERVHGVRQEGIYYGAASLMGKVASGFGSFLAGIIADVSGFTNLVDSTTVDPMVLFRFGIIWVTFSLIVAAIAVFIIRRYDIDHVRHAEILGELELRKSKAPIDK